MRKFLQFIVRKIPRPILIRFSYLFSFIFRVFYYGNKYECPVCGGKFRKFLPYGYKKSMTNRLCPKCLSLERHRLLWLYFGQKTDFFTQPAKMLHIAPEQCFVKKFRKLPHLDYKTADLESPLADMHFDIRKIPLEDNLYDFIMCNHVLEHIDEELVALKEFYRILKPGGKAILQVPLDYTLTETYENPSITDRKEREQVFGQYDHVRLYGTDYAERLAKAGFNVEVSDFLNEISPELRDKYRLPAIENIYIVHKPA